MIYFYLFALIVGGVLLASSALLGGDHEGGPEHSGDVGKEIVEAAGDVSGLFWIFRSLRFWMFFLAFFGLTGMVLGGFGLLESKALVGILALTTGFLCGFGAAKIIQHLTVADTDNSSTVKDYIGKSARVLIAINAKQTGKVRLQVRGTSVDILASGINGSSYAVDDEVFVVDVRGTTAYVSRDPGFDEALRPDNSTGERPWTR